MRETYEIGSEQLTDFIWQACLNAVEPQRQRMLTELAEVFSSAEQSQSKMNNEVGAISFASAISLYALTQYLKPQTVFEVGTYIGVSCLTIAKAMDCNGLPGKIYTCDGANPFELPVHITGTPIEGMPMMFSSQALSKLKEEQIKVDLVHLDGKLQDGDADLLADITTPHSVIALDDYTHGKKGMINQILLKQHPSFRNHVVIGPACAQHLKGFDVYNSQSKTALLMPATGFRFPLLQGRS